jgi:hypothetical protein
MQKDWMMNWFLSKWIQRILGLSPRLSSTAILTLHSYHSSLKMHGLGGTIAFVLYFLRRTSHTYHWTLNSLANLYSKSTPRIGQVRWGRTQNLTIIVLAPQLVSMPSKSPLLFL